MKAITQLSVLIMLSYFLLSAGCKKDGSAGDTLPPLTFEGKNTIGCKINGVPWVPKGITSGSGVIYPTSGGYYETAFFPGVHILIETNSSDGYIDFFCRNYTGYGYLNPGQYLVNKSTGDIHFGVGQIHSYGLYHTNGKTYITDSLHTGWIEIVKSDSINKIISGRFEFETYNASNGKTYKITEGRFDYRNH